MSGRTVSRALRDRFESIRQREIARLGKKLRGLSDAERESLDAITAHVVGALASLPDRALTDGEDARSLEAIVRLFALDADSFAAR
jgi:glutamyl-tRNA reductase